jgi:seryl-tRNA(Sec) selenium transferase
MKNEVIIQKSHRYGYDHAVRNCGIRFVEVETREELERALTDRTAMMMFLNENDPVGKIKAAEFVELGKKHSVPTFTDAAADVPPVDALSRYTKMGFELVTFSGGKGLRGPQSCGLLLGRKDLIAAARLNGPPNSDTIGRGMKVNKEEYLGMMVTIEQYMKRDHAAEWRDWEKRVKVIADSVGPIQGVKTEPFVPEIANAVPHLRISWTPGPVKVTPTEAVKRLARRRSLDRAAPGREGCARSRGVDAAARGSADIAKRIREVLKG